MLGGGGGEVRTRVKVFKRNLYRWSWWLALSIYVCVYSFKLDQLFTLLFGLHRIKTIIYPTFRLLRKWRWNAFGSILNDRFLEPKYVKSLFFCACSFGLQRVSPFQPTPTLVLWDIVLIFTEPSKLNKPCISDIVLLLGAI